MHNPVMQALYTEEQARNDNSVKKTDERDKKWLHSF